MNSEIFLKLSQHRGFWRLRAFVERQRFRLLSRIFRVRYFAREERANTGILFSFLTLTAWQLVLAMGIAGAFQLIELALIPQLVDRWRIPESANYVSWLSTVAQIGGVFIALYFTAVTAAASAIYAQVPNNVRDLLARERVGNIYIRYLTLATFIPLCFIALHLIGLEPLRLAIPLLVVMSGTGIIAFATLGRRAFNLFDPTRLAGSLFWELGRWLSQVSAGGFRWQDRSFQNHAHRQARAAAETLETLADLASTHANLDSAPLLDLSVNILLFLAGYQVRKLGIPTDSLWFEQKYEHRQWYMTEDSTTTMAHRTGAFLGPSAVPEYNWLEAQLEKIPLRCFEINAARKRLDNVRDLLTTIDAYVTALAANGNVRASTSLVRKVRELYEQTNSEKEEAGSKKQEEMRDVGLADAICSLYLRPLLAYRTALEKQTIDGTTERLRTMRWLEHESLYRNGFLGNELRQLEWLFPRIKMEIGAEGSMQTPVWYCRDLLLKSQADNLGQSVEAVLAIGSELMAWSARLVNAGRVWQSAALLSRHLEYLSKLDYHVGYFAARAEQLQSARHLTDLPWPDLKPASWAQAASEQSEQLGRLIAQHIRLLSQSKRPENVPDYRGQFIHTTGENLFDALLKRKPDEVAVLIPAYLPGSLSLFEELRPSRTETFDVFTEQSLQIAAAPVIDVLELSGYAYLLADLYQDQEIWTPVRSVWDTLLQASPVTLNWFAAIMTAGIPRFQIPHRGLVRTNWSMRVQHELNKLPRRNMVRGGPGGIFSSDTILHPSALVRYCARYNFHNGRDIFAALYLSTLQGSHGLEWGHGVRNLNESLEHEEEREYGQEREDEEEEEEGNETSE